MTAHSTNVEPTLPVVCPVVARLSLVAAWMVGRHNDAFIFNLQSFPKSGMMTCLCSVVGANFDEQHWNVRRYATRLDYIRVIMILQDWTFERNGSKHVRLRRARQRTSRNEGSCVVLCWRRWWWCRCRGHSQDSLVYKLSDEKVDSPLMTICWRDLEWLLLFGVVRGIKKSFLVRCWSVMVLGWSMCSHDDAKATHNNSVCVSKKGDVTNDRNWWRKGGEWEI